MSHAYPIGKTARDALKNAQAAARTRYEAEDLADGFAIKALETEWITPSAKDLPKMLEQAEANPVHGFVQNYEDADGNPVLAITFWKLAKTQKPPKPAPKPAPAAKLGFRVREPTFAFPFCLAFCLALNLAL